MSPEALTRDGSSTRGARAGGAAVTMIAGDDGPPLQVGQIEIADVTWRARANGKIEHLIEIAVIERAVPANRQRVAAHHAGGGGRIERLSQPLHVPLIVSALDEELQKAADRHVRDRVEMIEFNAVFGAQFLAELRFDGVLFGRQ